LIAFFIMVGRVPAMMTINRYLPRQTDSASSTLRRFRSQYDGWLHWLCIAFISAAKSAAMPSDEVHEVLIGSTT
jgi:hypothetical protein